MMLEKPILYLSLEILISCIIDKAFTELDCMYESHSDIAGTAYPSRSLEAPPFFVGSMLFLFSVLCFLFCKSSFCILYLMLLVSLDCPFLIAPSIFYKFIVRTQVQTIRRIIKFVKFAETGFKHQLNISLN